MVSGMEETDRLLLDNLLEAHGWESKYAGGNDVTFEVGNRVLMST